MDFNLDDSQKKLARQIAETCRERLPERPTAHFSPEQWAVCGEAGLLGLSIPRDYGGQGLGALSTAVAMHAFGHSCADMGLVQRHHRARRGFRLDRTEDPRTAAGRRWLYP
ncbi:acyl-CoA dehydrogenase family protein [Pseudomonas aeruginosa]|uniref:acyl-CoA dehydrogenase family protein n=1 Tax=Pseudomonas aeruginosa TaxID=287 RepID=UPI001FFAFE32|nr:acyl-CoA dehydrogenase family protein [Pseudomonas aeruginosa]